MDSWWETPLNSSFINKVKVEIYSGNIALVFLPTHSPSNFLSQFKYSLDRNTTIEKINLNDCDESDKPIESLLYNHFDIEDNSKKLIRKDIVSIFKYVESDESEYGDTDLIVFENLNRSIVDEFKKVILALGHYLSSIDVYKRKKILVIIDSDVIKEEDFINESGIAKLLFQGSFDKLDTILGIRYYHSYQTNKYTSLFESIIASLSIFDMELVDELVQCDNLILDYEDVLTKYGNAKDWNEIKYKSIDELSDVDIWNRWSIGILEIKDNKPVYHSSYLMLNKRKHKVDKRVWIAMLESLTPVIEEFRDRFVKSNRIEFNGTFYNIYGESLIKEKLQIGEISKYLGKKQIHLKVFNPDERRKIRNILFTSKDIRDDLSHLKVPEYKKIKYLISEMNSVLDYLR